MAALMLISYGIGYDYFIVAGTVLTIVEAEYILAHDNLDFV